MFSLFLVQAWANYGLGAKCSLFSFLIQPDELEESLLIASEKVAAFISKRLIFCCGTCPLSILWYIISCYDVAHRNTPCICSCSSHLCDLVFSGFSVELIEGRGRNLLWWMRAKTRRFPQCSPASTSPPAGSECSSGFHSQQCKLSFVKWPSPSHLVLLQLVLVGVLALAFPPQLLQLWVGSVKRVLLHLVLHLVPFKRGLKQKEFTAVYSTRHLVTFHYTQKL